MDMPLSRDPALADALASVGGAGPLAEQLGITRAAVAQWRTVPASRVLDVERLTGVSRYRLRPDVFGEPPEAVAS